MRLSRSASLKHNMGSVGDRRAGFPTIEEAESRARADRRRHGNRTDSALLSTEEVQPGRRTVSENYNGSSPGGSAHTSPAKTPNRATYANVVSGNNTPNVSPAKVKANDVDDSGPNPQPLRGIPGFQNQQQPQARNTVNAGRVPNAKLGMPIHRSTMCWLAMWSKVIQC